MYSSIYLALAPAIFIATTCRGKFPANTALILRTRCTHLPGILKLCFERMLADFALYICTAVALHCEDFAPDKIESSVSKCSALQTATLATAEFCSAEIDTINQKCKSGDNTATCSCFAASKLFICQSFFEIESLVNRDCALVGQLLQGKQLQVKQLQVDQYTKATVHANEICKPEMNVIRATQAACDRTPSNDGPLPVSSKMCEILPDSTQAHQLSCDDLAAYLVFLRADKTLYAKSNCFSKVSALRSARAACAAEFIPEGESR